MTAALSIGPVLGGEVLAEGSLGALAIFWSAARADFARSISDDPNRPLAQGAIGVSVFRAKPENLRRVQSQAAPSTLPCAIHWLRALRRPWRAHQRTGPRIGSTQLILQLQELGRLLTHYYSKYMTHS